MPGNVCCVAACKNTATNTKLSKARFFSFPKNEAVRKKWIKWCNRRDKFNYSSARICSHHFTPDDFEDGLKARIMNEIPRRLKSTSVPTLNILPVLPRQIHENSVSVQKQKGSLKNRVKIVNKSATSKTEGISSVGELPNRSDENPSTTINNKSLSGLNSTTQGISSLAPVYYLVLPNQTEISTLRQEQHCKKTEEISNNILKTFSNVKDDISLLNSLPYQTDPNFVSVQEQGPNFEINETIKVEVVNCSNDSDDEHLLSTPEEEGALCDPLKIADDGILSTPSTTQGICSFSPGYLVVPNQMDKNLTLTALDQEEVVRNKKRQKLVNEVLNCNKRDTFITKEERIPTACNEENYKILQRKFNNILTENKNLKKQLLVKETLLLEKSLEFEQFTSLKTDLAIKNLFSEFLTTNQLNYILKKKKKVFWTTEEISKAFTLRYLSKQAYKYVRQTLKYPLPGISTMQRWAANISFKNGLLKDVLNIMNTVGKFKDDLKRLTVLSFGKMKICGTYEYDHKDNKMVGPHNYIQVIMCRGLFDNWKQPIFIGFDRKITKSVLLEVITNLHNINYHVVACVSDCGPSSVSLWKELDISHNKTYCHHPITEEKIYFFVDVNHTLKLIRNGFLSTGFTIDGKVISKEPLQELLKLTNPSITSCHEISLLHISCAKKYRQNIALAKQLLSCTTATAIRCYLPGEDAALCIQLADFIDLVSNWFNIMNSSTLNTQINVEKPYGECLNFQDEILNQVKCDFLDLECISNSTMQNFQKGVIISTCSLQQMFKSLREKYKISNILSCRLNHDCLDNLFSKLRTAGTTNGHPAPLLALYKLKKILMGKSIDTEMPSEDEFIVTAALKRAKVPNSTENLESRVEELEFPSTVEVQYSPSAMECK